MTKNEMVCTYCGQQRVACKAHIIPYYFFRKINQNGLMRLNRSAQKSYRKVSRACPKGLFDNTIICLNCEETVFKEIDNLAINSFFQKQSNLIEKVSHEQYSLHDFPNLNPNILYKFLLSILWRASISNKCPGIKLGPYTAEIKQEIESPTFNFKTFFIRNLPSTDPYLVKHNIEEETTLQFIEPFYQTIGSERIRLCIFHLGNYMAGIYITQNSLPNNAPYKNFILNPNQKITILSIPYDESMTREYMFEVLKSTTWE